MLRRVSWSLALALMLVLSISITGIATPQSESHDPSPNGKANGKPHQEEATASSATAQHQEEEDCDGDPTGNSQTGHGANKDDTYDNTCYDGPSRNGEGEGAATGKPCAGCVGQADDKNPPGQEPKPGGSDHNNGYECDGNKGIAKTNPAHTSCKTSTPPPGPCVTNCGPPPCVENCGPPPCVENCGPPPPNPRNTQVLGVNFTRASAATALPATGIDAGMLAFIGVGLIGLGVAISSRKQKVVLDS